MNDKLKTIDASIAYFDAGFGCAEAVLKAVAEYKKLLRMNASNFLANYNLGKIYYGEAQLDEDNQALRNAKDINPGRFERYEAIFKART